MYDITAGRDIFCLPAVYFDEGNECVTAGGTMKGVPAVNDRREKAKTTAGRGIECCSGGKMQERRSEDYGRER